MTKFNSTYLNPALKSLEANAESWVKNAESTTIRRNADSSSIANKAKAELFYKQNISTGYKYALILVGVGILSVFLAWAASVIIHAIKSDPKESQNLIAIEDKISKSNQTLTDLSTSLASGQLVKSSDLDAYFAKFELIRSETEKSNKALAVELASIKNELQTLEPQSGSKTVNYSGYSLQNSAFNENSTLCHDNKSFEVECTDTVKFENDWRYTGTWKNGMPNGDGKIIFPGGVVLEAKFEQGQPIEIVTEQVEEKSILKSVTHFHSSDASKINRNFRNVNIGYKFETGGDTAWKSAYCYLAIKSGDNNLREELSSFPSFSSKLSESYYRRTNLYTSNEFNSAKKLCNYKRTGFN